MAAQTYAQLRTRLNITLSDQADKTFSSGEKDEFMNRAINDPAVFKIARDNSLTTDSTTLIYSLPDNTQEVTDVFVDILGDGVGALIDRDSYDVIDGSLYFQEVHKPLINNKNIILFIKKKLTINDSIDDFLQEYVLILSEIEAYSFMKNKFSTRFLKNDVTMVELLNSISERKAHAQELRRQLANKRAIAG